MHRVKQKVVKINAVEKKTSGTIFTPCIKWFFFSHYLTFIIFYFHFFSICLSVSHILSLSLGLSQGLSLSLFLSLSLYLSPFLSPPPPAPSLSVHIRHTHTHVYTHTHKAQLTISLFFSLSFSIRFTIPVFRPIYQSTPNLLWVLSICFCVRKNCSFLRSNNSQPLFADRKKWSQFLFDFWRLLRFSSSCVDIAQQTQINE